MDTEAKILQAMESMEGRLSANITNLQSEIRGKLQHLDNEVQVAKTKILEHDEKMSNYERESRKRNLIIRGLSEEENNIKELEQHVLNFLNDTIKVEIAITEIDQIYRLGQKSVNKIRPVMIKLLSARKKGEILQNKNKLSNTTISINEDFPKDVIETRKRLTPLLIKYRKQNIHAVIKYDSLYIDHRKMNPDQIKELEQAKNKRKPSNESIIDGKDKHKIPKDNIKHATPDTLCTLSILQQPSQTIIPTQTEARRPPGRPRNNSLNKKPQRSGSAPSSASRSSSVSKSKEKHITNNLSQIELDQQTPLIQQDPFFDQIPTTSISTKQ